MDSVDARLVRAWIQRRDADAFAQLFSRYSAMVYGTCNRILRNAVDAEDVAQECFIELAQGAATIHSSLVGWLHTVATHRSLNRIEAERRRKRRESGSVSTAPPTMATHWSDVKGLVDEAITALPPEYREPIVRCYFDGQTQEALAQSLGLSRRQVRYRLDKGIALIRKTLRKRGVSVAAPALLAMLDAHLAEGAVVPASLSASVSKLALAGMPNSPMTSTVPASGAANTFRGLLATKQAAVFLCVCVVAGVLMWAGRSREKYAPAGVHEPVTPAVLVGTQPGEDLSSLPESFLHSAASPQQRTTTKRQATTPASGIGTVLDVYLIGSDEEFGATLPSPPHLPPILKELEGAHGVTGLRLVKATTVQCPDRHAMEFAVHMYADSEYVSGPVLYPSTATQPERHAAAASAEQKTGPPKRLPVGDGVGPKLYIFKTEEVSVDPGARDIHIKAMRCGVDTPVPPALGAGSGHAKVSRVTYGLQKDRVAINDGRTATLGRMELDPPASIEAAVQEYTSTHALFLAIRARILE